MLLTIYNQTEFGWFNSICFSFNFPTLHDFINKHLSLWLLYIIVLIITKTRHLTPPTIHPLRCGNAAMCLLLPPPQTKPKTFKPCVRACVGMGWWWCVPNCVCNGPARPVRPVVCREHPCRQYSPVAYPRLLTWLELGPNMGEPWRTKEGEGERKLHQHPTHHFTNKIYHKKNFELTTRLTDTRSKYHKNTTISTFSEK